MLTWILLGAGIGAVVFFYFQFLKPRDQGTRTLPAPDYVGNTGTVTSDVVDASGGRVKVIDSHGEPSELRARVEAGAPSLERGTEILVIENPRGNVGAVVMANDLPDLGDG